MTATRSLNPTDESMNDVTDSPRPLEPGAEPMTRQVDVLREIERRILWLATRMIDVANRERRVPTAPKGREAEFQIKVGGHQASSASMVGIMTTLWFGYLRRHDKVAVKPHAGPVYHAIKYLTGELDRSYLTRLRDFGGLQAYPSRTKDPDVADFSTGSVGLGATAPLFAAATRRYIEAQFGAAAGAASRFIGLLGDAELDEGNIWEAITDPALEGLGNVIWVVDVNRQSLDRVIPNMKVRKLIRVFEVAGWHVVEAKYGEQLDGILQQAGGQALRERLDDMPNEEYQALLALDGSAVRTRLCVGPHSPVHVALQPIADDDLTGLIRDLGGHDHQTLLSSLRACDGVTDRPSVIFAYTIKGWGLPIAGDPLNHAAMLTAEQIEVLREQCGRTPADEWDRFDRDTEPGRLCERVGRELNNEPAPPRPSVPAPVSTRSPADRPIATQGAFGRILSSLADHPGVGPRLVTVSPDVSVSTNLGAWINKVGVFNRTEVPDLPGGGRLLRWHQSPKGQHIELGISEMNLFLYLHALGLGHELHGEQLLPVGTVYDPFVCRGLDGLIYALYNRARFIVAGTPAGVTLSPEGGAHQSTITASIGIELPNISLAEPSYAQALDWLLCDGLRRLGDPNGESLYLRLSTRPIDQTPFNRVIDRLGTDQLRADVIAGGYRLFEPAQPADVVIAACGAVVPEAHAAAVELQTEGVAATVLDLTSPDRLFRGWRQQLTDATRTAHTARATHHLSRILLPFERQLPIVAVHDAASHALAWLGSVFGARVIPVGVDEFGQSGDLISLYRHFDLISNQLVNAALVAVA